MNERVAIIVDALPGIGGAERVLQAVLELFPAATIFTLLYNREAFSSTPIADRVVKTSFIEKLPRAQTHYRSYLPLMPFAIERFDLREFDTILSFNYAVAHGVRVGPGQRHLSYTYTPMRYAWRNQQPSGTAHSTQWIIAWLLQRFRQWDWAAARRVHHFAAVSQWIARWVSQAYQREARVIYPPVDVERFTPDPDRDRYYVTVSRLVAHKRVDLMVEAFNRLGLPLLVVGDGPERQRLAGIAGQNIRFLGYQTDDAVTRLLNRARGYISAGDEDFGISVVEAQAAGCPVVSYRQGGVLETVIEDQTGVFFDQPTPDSLVEAVVRMERCWARFNPAELVLNARRFSKPQFIAEFQSFLAAAGWQANLSALPAAYPAQPVRPEG